MCSSCRSVFETSRYTVAPPLLLSLTRSPGAFSIAKEHGQQQAFTEAIVCQPTMTLVKCLPVGHEEQMLEESVRKNKTTSTAASAFVAAVKEMLTKGRPMATMWIAKFLETANADNLRSVVARCLQMAYAWGVATDVDISSAIADAQKQVRPYHASV
jgi:hypothetical protein